MIRSKHTAYFKEERICPYCGESFLPKRVKQDYCGKIECKNKRRNELIKKGVLKNGKYKAKVKTSCMIFYCKCAICGKVFISKRENTNVCDNLTCKYFKKKKRNMQWIEENTIKCAYCQKLFTKKRKDQKYCNDSECKKERNRYFKKRKEYELLLGKYL